MKKEKDKDPFQDLHSWMEQARKERELRSAGNGNIENADVLEKLLGIVKPVVESFVEGDKSLHIQSSDIQGIYVSYGYHTGMFLLLAAPSKDRVSASIQSDNSTKMDVYFGTYDEKAIKNAVQNALKNWYLSVV